MPSSYRMKSVPRCDRSRRVRVSGGPKGTVRTVQTPKTSLMVSSRPERTTKCILMAIVATPARINAARYRLSSPLVNPTAAVSQSSAKICDQSGGRKISVSESLPLAIIVSLRVTKIPRVPIKKMSIPSPADQMPNFIRTPIRSCTTRPWCPLA